jgi:hypothetical protein
LLGLAHRLHVPSYRRWIDKVIRQQLDPTTTTFLSSGHWRRADWLRVLDLWRANDYFQSRFWRHVVALPSSCRGGFFNHHLHRLGGFFGSSLGV